MKFWQYILYRDVGKKQLENEIAYERREKNLKLNVVENDWKTQGKRKEKLHQRLVAIFLFLGGLILLMNFKEIGFFVLGTGLYALAPETHRPIRISPAPRYMVMVFFSAGLLILVTATLFLISPDNAIENLIQLLWLLLGSITMCFICSFKQYISRA